MTPKHTDEEYDNLQRDYRLTTGRCQILEARIKELEADNHRLRIMYYGDPEEAKQ